MIRYISRELTNWSVVENQKKKKTLTGIGAKSGGVVGWWGGGVVGVGKIGRAHV